jgi:hypothetical protein
MVEVYSTQEGKQPFTEWLNSLKDKHGVDKILLRIRRIQLGNLGDINLLPMAFLSYGSKSALVTEFILVE